MAKLSKSARAKFLENFEAIDYIVFGKPVRELEDACCRDTLIEYITTKAALLSNLIDICKLVEYSPSDGVPINMQVFQENAVEAAKLSKKSASKIVRSEKAIAEIKDAVSKTIRENQNLSPSEISEIAAKSKAFCLAIDELLIKRTLFESKNYNKITEDFPGKIQIDSYQFLRDDLVSLAMIIRRLAGIDSK